MNQLAIIMMLLNQMLIGLLLVSTWFLDSVFICTSAKSVCVFVCVGVYMHVCVGACVRVRVCMHAL